LNHMNHEDHEDHEEKWDLKIIELKSVDRIQRIHEAQLLTYMKLTRIPVGLLINFNVLQLKKCIRRFVL